MKIEEINCLIDAYQDGEIAKTDALRLADVIRSGGSQSDWIMRELEMRGLIAHVFDETSSSRFVNSLMSRFRAEPESEQFEQDFKKRLGETQRSRPSSQNEEFKRAIHTVGSATEADTKSSVSYKPAKLWMVILLVLSIGLVLLILPLLNKEVATLKTSSRGLHVYRGNTEVPLKDKMPLYAGDRLSALGQGKVELVLGNQILVSLWNESSVVFELKGEVLERPEYTGLPSMFVERGHVEISSPKQPSDLVIWTPHAVLTFKEGKCETRTSELSTMFKLNNIKATLSTLLGSKSRTLNGNMTILVNDAGQIEEHRLNGEILNGK